MEMTSKQHTTTLTMGTVYSVASLEFLGWNSDDVDGYHVEDYFDGFGRYLGPDQHGVEPMFSWDSVRTYS